MTAARRLPRTLSGYFSLIRFALIAGLAFLLVFGIQPWYRVTSPFFASAITHFPGVTPLIEAIASVWWIGKPLAGLLILICENGVDLGVILLYLLVTLAETAGMVLKIRGIEADALVGSNGAIEKRILGFLQLLTTVRLAAYCAELAVLFADYEVYGSGLMELITDLNPMDIINNSLDVAKWNPGQIGLGLVNMFGFEGVLAVILGLWSGLSVITILFNASQPQPQPIRAKAAK